nr:DUF2235 domain-containing protein [Mesorhizobium sp. M8A.F.Ca.ET.021.01.1.1]
MLRCSSLLRPWHWSGTDRRQFFSRFYSPLHNLVSQATGLGLTRNMLQCYGAIIRLWRPGDKILAAALTRFAL